MNKERLKQDAEEYAKKLLEGTEFEDDDMVGCAYTKREMLEAILHFAEPREKRIAELEAQIEKMKCCGNCKHQCSFLFQDEIDCFNNNLSNWELGEIKEK